MNEFVKELEQLPQYRQVDFIEGVQRKVIAQAVFVRDEQPENFLAYVDGEIEDANASMFKMVQESSKEGAELYSISEVYIWNKERKQALVRLRDEFLQQNPQNQNQEPQQGTRRGKGRPKKSFKDLVINDPDGSKLQKIHALMKGQKSKGAGLIMLACIKKGWISKPTYAQVTDEFGDIGTQQGFTPYLNEQKFAKEELEGAINSLN